MTWTADSRPDRSAATDRVPAGGALVVFDSSRVTGWRSVLLQRVVNDPVVDRLELAARGEQTLVLTTRGRAVVESLGGGGHWRRCDYAPGLLGMTAPGRSVTLRWRTVSPEPKETLHVYLPGQVMADTATHLWGREVAPEDLPDTLGINDRLIEATMLAMADAAAGFADDLYAESAALFLATHLLSRPGGTGRPAVRTGRQDPRLRRAIEFMHQNLAQPITLADIANAAGVSLFHFVRTFGAATGEPPRRYLTRLRVEDACRHLTQDSASITEIAFRCGFSSSAHLSAAVRRRTGISPTEYRRNHAIP